LIIIFSSGNLGPDDCTITPPKEAKNPIVVGGTMNYRPGLLDGCGSLDNYKALDFCSSRGPAVDNRILPTIVATGAKVSSAWSQTGNPAEFRNDFVPGTDRKYMFGSGTSFATAQVSGFCALIVEWWRKHKNTEPSLALIKAILVNTAEDLAGNPSKKDDNGEIVLLDHIPNNHQGWGLVNLKNFFDRPESILMFDQATPFRSTGEVQSYNVDTKDVNLPLKITLVWTDPPGEPRGHKALVNDLDLEVEEISTGSIFKGNVFEKGFSIVGGNFDEYNNIECVYIKNPVGSYKVNIIASDLNKDAKPPFGSSEWQDYSLVVANARETTN
jgi:hypothetical protein